MNTLSIDHQPDSNDKNNLRTNSQDEDPNKDHDESLPEPPQNRFLDLKRKGNYVASAETSTDVSSIHVEIPETTKLEETRNASSNSLSPIPEQSSVLKHRTSISSLMQSDPNAIACSNQENSMQHEKFPLPEKYYRERGGRKKSGASMGGSWDHSVPQPNILEEFQKHLLDEQSKKFRELYGASAEEIVNLLSPMGELMTPSRKIGKQNSKIVSSPRVNKTDLSSRAGSIEDDRPGYDFFGKDSRYLDRYMFVLIWLGLLLLGWLANYSICALAHFPSDCVPTKNAKSVMEDVQGLMLHGMAMAWLCNLTYRPRFWGVFSRKRWYFFVLYFASQISFNLLGMIPFFSENGGLITAGKVNYAVVTSSIIVLIVVVGWHIWFAKVSFRKTDVICFIVSRCSMLLFYTAQSIIVLTSSNAFILHFHHWLVGFALSLFCQFDHWFSICCLAILSGVFVQGLGAYGYASLFSVRNNNNCVYFQTVDTGLRQGFRTMACQAEKPFYATLCLNSDTGDITTSVPPELKCTRDLVVSADEASLWYNWPHKF